VFLPRAPEHISYGARDAAIAVIERVDGDEPEMGDAGLENGIGRRRFEPLEKARHFRVQPRGLRGFIVDVLTSTMKPRYHLHGIALARSPCSDRDAAHAAAPRKEKRRVPAEQPVCG